MDMVLGHVAVGLSRRFASIARHVLHTIVAV